MKIAVFGDSYANKNVDNIWWKYLEDHGHQVKSYGEPGSSVLFGAQTVMQHAWEYDFAILALTCPGRLSVRRDNAGGFIHINSLWSSTTDYDIAQAAKMYWALLWDRHDDDLVGIALAEFVLSHNPNLMIIPCFPSPLGKDFNLFNVSFREVQAVLSDFKLEGGTYRLKSNPGDLTKYYDKRTGHLTDQNQKILANIVNQNLKPGVFQTGYDQFCYDNYSVDDILEKR
jgi:hypothetical protein